ncbi:precorrin-3B C(17)-methyltransferase [Nakamurella endophytica]|uniref:Precorrin-3B C(17)-methyltransferase n=1 Tax=Nakamurella endophytica TaxID=1748367 RepID=A0A917WAU7_9ACTN|nr:precorrin-3B C(17)-methyltransferase [Nakamurella endophytica]
MTRKAARLIGAADVVAYFSGTHGRSIARSIAAELLPAGVAEEPLVYPVTTGDIDHPGGYPGAIDDFYDRSAARLAVHLAAGRTVVVLCEGDPLFYGSYMYLHDRLAPTFPAEVVPGVTSVSGAAAAAARPLVRHEDVLTVLPGTLPRAELARRLADTQGAAVLKLGRTFPAVRAALAEAGRLDDAVYVERASTAGQRVLPAGDVDPDAVPYFSMVLVPGADRRLARAAETGAAAPAPADPGPATGAPPGPVLVVGLGPGPDGWRTPEVDTALGQVRHVVGYAPYVSRVPQREGLQRHASGNTVELDRARHALELALAGDPVAVVSGGDAGVFGMASAVFEVLDGDTAGRYRDVPVRVLPGVTAAQAVAARAGAPLGGDYAVLSLSDRLKPWPVVERRLAAVAAADLVLAVYNPASRSRTGQVARMRDVLLAHRSPDVPVVIGRDVGRDGEELVVTTLGGLDPAVVDMRCLLIVGSSGTTAGEHGVWTRRFVPAGPDSRDDRAADRTGDGAGDPGGAGSATAPTGAAAVLRR